MFKLKTLHTKQEINMNKSLIVLKHDEYKSLNDFLIGLEVAIINGKDSYYNVIISGTIDPFSNPIFYRDGYTTMIRMAEVAKHLKTRLSIQINTRMPVTLSNKTIRDVFHIYPVSINYYITNNSFECDTHFVSIDEAVRKLETWDGKNPMMTKIVLDIDERIHNVRRQSIIKAVNNTYVALGLDDPAEFRITQSNAEKIKTLLSN